MKNIKCPHCTLDLQENGNFMECPDDENCGYRISKVKLKKQNQHWLINILEDNNLWAKEIFDLNLPIISNEYKRLYTLCKEKQSYGMFLEIKDIFEVLIKFPILLVVSKIDYNQANANETQFLTTMLEKQLSLGDWSNLARQAHNITNDKNLKMWLKNILATFNKNNILAWRNEEIGHGALGLDETKEFQNDIEKKLQSFKYFFDRNRENLESSLKTDEYLDSIFFENIEKYLYFFDSFNIRNKKTSRLDYIQGNLQKRVEQEFINLSEMLHITEGINKLEQSAEDTIIFNASTEILENLQRVDDYNKPEYLTNWVKDTIETNSKGVLLLQMQRGMGKSMFVRALDELSLSSQITLDTLAVRAFYINDTYSNTLSHFSDSLIHSILNIRQTDMKPLLKQGYPDNLRLNSKTLSKDFADILEYYKNIYTQEKLLFVIDGVDEIPNLTEKGILDSIPSATTLPENIFILITSRIDIPTILKNRLATIDFLDSKQVELDNNQYLENTREYIKRHIFDKREPKEELLLTIYTRSENRFVYIKLIKELIKNMGLSVENLPKADKITETYLNHLEQKYGSKFFQNISNLLSVIATQFEPMTLKEIAYMLEKESITF